MKAIRFATGMTSFFICGVYARKAANGELIAGPDFLLLLAAIFGVTWFLASIWSHE